MTFSPVNLVMNFVTNSPDVSMPTSPVFPANCPQAGKWGTDLTPEAFELSERLNGQEHAHRSSTVFFVKVRFVFLYKYDDFSVFF